jgi:hypothetical protein
MPGQRDDFDSILVGGSEKLVRRVLEDQRLEDPSEAGLT